MKPMLFKSMGRSAAIFAVALAAPALADTVLYRAPGGSHATAYPDVKISGVDNGQISFTTSTGNDVSKDFSNVVGMKIDDEPAFNDAETQYDAGKFDAAVDKYDQTISKTSKPWLKDYCQIKLCDAANQSGRFDEAVNAYIAIVMRSVEIAAKHRPTIPDQGSSYLDPAAKTVSYAADAADIKGEQQTVLLGFLLDIQKARHNQAGIDAVAKRLSGNAAETGDPGAAAASGAVADAKLALVRDAVKNGQFDQAASMIDSSRAMFTDPHQQNDALWLRAEAAEGQAAAKGDDKDAMKDAAIAYMRVVADFKDVSGATHVADSLMHVGAILEKLQQNDKAMETYASVTKDYPGTPQATAAQQAIDRLKAAGK